MKNDKVLIIIIGDYWGRLLKVGGKNLFFILMIVVEVIILRNMVKAVIKMGFSNV